MTFFRRPAINPRSPQARDLHYSWLAAAFYLVKNRCKALTYLTTEPLHAMEALSIFLACVVNIPETVVTERN